MTQKVVPRDSSKGGSGIQRCLAHMCVHDECKGWCKNLKKKPYGPVEMAIEMMAPRPALNVGDKKTPFYLRACGQKPYHPGKILMLGQILDLCISHFCDGVLRPALPRIGFHDTYHAENIGNQPRALISVGLNLFGGRLWNEGGDYCLSVQPQRGRERDRMKVYLYPFECCRAPG